MPYRDKEKKASYQAWFSMIDRCHNKRHPAFKDYGGRGIVVCEAWRENFEQFVADVGLRPTAAHSLDRHPNPDGNYGPGNVRWATMKEQSNNRRSNRLITYNDETLTVRQWAERLFPDNPHRIQKRLVLGWSIERALSTSIRKKRPNGG